MKILLKGIFSSDNSNKLTSLELEQEKHKLNYYVSDIKSKIIENFKLLDQAILKNNFSLYSNGKFLLDDSPIKLAKNQIIEIKYTLLGGKVN